jgi:hypothetical protein
MVAQAAQPISFSFLPQAPLVVQRHQGQISSDAGLLPLRQFDDRWNYTRRMADCLHDAKPDRQHSLLSMLRQRFYGILAGYEDCNDHDTLRDDPIFKIVADRLPEGQSLASQPTLSRFENLPTPADLQKLIDFTIATGVERLKEKHGGQLPAVVTLDLDATDDATHGDQQLTLFHGYYSQYQYYPLIVSEPTTRHVFIAALRHGTAHASLGADDDVMRVVNALRKEKPDIIVHIRGDAGFGMPVMYDVCEKNGLLYTFGFSSNPRLKRLTEDLLQSASKQHEQTGEKARLFECFNYKCNDWERPRTVIAKAECHAGGTNRRFIVTNLAAACPLDKGATEAAGSLPITDAAQGEATYDHYILRGESEHRMDELKNGLHMDRLSCHRFMANYFRLLLRTSAYNLFNALRDHPNMPQGMRAGQPQTWRTTLIKVAAEVVQTTRRVIIRLAAQWPWWPIYNAVAACSTAHSTSS